MKNAKEVIERFWEIQDEGDYTKLVDLFSEDAVFEDPIYAGLPKEFEVGRYHSWQVKKGSLGETFQLTGVDENGNVMSMRHKELDVVGVQYHPESVLTEHGLKIIENWLKN